MLPYFIVLKPKPNSQVPITDELIGHAQEVLEGKRKVLVLPPGVEAQFVWTGSVPLSTVVNPLSFLQGT